MRLIKKLVSVCAISFMSILTFVTSDVMAARTPADVRHVVYETETINFNTNNSYYMNQWYSGGTYPVNKALSSTNYDLTHVDKLTFQYDYGATTTVAGAWMKMYIYLVDNITDTRTEIWKKEDTYVTTTGRGRSNYLDIRFEDAVVDLKQLKNQGIGLSNVHFEVDLYLRSLNGSGSGNSRVYDTGYVWISRDIEAEVSEDLFSGNLYYKDVPESAYDINNYDLFNVYMNRDFANEGPTSTGYSPSAPGYWYSQAFYTDTFNITDVKYLWFYSTGYNSDNSAFEICRTDGSVIATVNSNELIDVDSLRGDVFLKAKASFIDNPDTRSVTLSPIHYVGGHEITRSPSFIYSN